MHSFYYSNETKVDVKAIAIKILTPLMALGVVYMFSWEGTVANISILQAAMGPMITAGEVASMAGLAPRLSSAIVGYGTIISFLSTWLVFGLLVDSL